MAVHEQLVFAVSLILRDRREALDISQSDLARKSGLHRSYIGDLERGSRNLSLKNLSRLAEALDLAPSKMLSLAEKKLASEGPFKTKRKTAAKPATGRASSAKSGKTVKVAKRVSSRG
ncbi:MAG TPA: helix-turn-helix transcriptional regulator [Oculatellaceae cyanobacterium]